MTEKIHLDITSPATVDAALRGSVNAASSLQSLPFDNTFGELPAAFHTVLKPTPLPEPVLVAGSANAAALVGMDRTLFETRDFVEIFTGNKTASRSIPLAAVYSGHQFGVWAGQLGDGRAILLGDLPAPTVSPSKTMEVQLKGSGPTPYSRRGDGRAVLRSSIREFLCSEAMAALGIPTSRALCITASTLQVMREIPETTAVVTRMAPSFVRFGSFEHWFYNDKPDELKILADHVINRFYPHLRDVRHPYQALLAEVTGRTARMIAQWQAVGFMHGVMNTDNMSIIGITLDYGPFGFMEAFDAGHICNHSDQQARYSYAMQPRIGHWNCFALGQALLPLIGKVEAVEQALSVYEEIFKSTSDVLMRAKLGLRTNFPEDNLLIDGLFSLLQDNHVDFTLFFRKLCDLSSSKAGTNESMRNLFIDREAFDVWALQYCLRLAREGSVDEERQVAMRLINPKYVLRNYLAQVAIECAQKSDFSEVRKLLAILEKPFDEQPEYERYAQLPPDWANNLEVSCSS